MQWGKQRELYPAHTVPNTNPASIQGNRPCVHHNAHGQKFFTLSYPEKILSIPHVFLRTFVISPTSEHTTSFCSDPFL